MKHIMKRAVTALLIVSVMLSLTGCVTGTIYGRPLKTVEGTAVAQGTIILSEVMRHMNEGDEAAIKGMFSPYATQEEMQFDLFLEQWKTFWEEYGNALDGGMTESYKFADDYVFVYAMGMEKGGRLLLQGKLNSDLELVSLFLYETVEEFDAKQTLPENVIEEDIILGEGTAHPLNAKLTYPQNAKDAEGTIPAAVLVPGDGANTMDMKAGSTKLYRDLAYALAKNGIAVIRYDKRTYTYQQEATVENTPKETQTVAYEYIEDACLAFETLAGLSFVDDSRIFYIGHSQGAIVAPRADEENPYGTFAGYVLINSSPRPWMQVIYDQYINYGLIDRSDDEIYYLVNKLKTEKKFIEDGSIYKVSEQEALQDFLLGRSAYFWQDYLSYDYVEGFKKAQKPLLILQGGTDYQITEDTDFAAFKETFEGASYVTFQSYEGLNHLMVRSQGAFSGHYKEYDIPGAAGETFLNDLCSWILEQK